MFIFIDIHEFRHIKNIRHLGTLFKSLPEIFRRQYICTVSYQCQINSQRTKK